MAMHQYIGARYVPYYYENSLDPTSTEWEPNVTYEPLTVVTLPNLHSYISKKLVPDTIGSPASNPAYWLDTGYANAYIAQLQQDVSDINDILDEFVGYHIVIKSGMSLADLNTLINDYGKRCSLVLMASIDCSGGGTLSSYVEEIIGAGGMFTSTSAATLAVNSGVRIKSRAQLFNNLYCVCSTGFIDGEATPMMFGMTGTKNVNVNTEMAFMIGSTFRIFHFTRGTYYANIANDKSGRTFIFDPDVIIDGVLHIATGSAGNIVKDVTVIGTIYTTQRVGTYYCDGVYMDDIVIMDPDSSYDGQTGNQGMGLGVHLTNSSENVFIKHIQMDVVNTRGDGVYNAALILDGSPASNNIKIESMKIGICSGSSAYPIIIDNCQHIYIDDVNVSSSEMPYSFANSAFIHISNLRGFFNATVGINFNNAQVNIIRAVISSSGTIAVNATNNSNIIFNFVRSTGGCSIGVRSDSSHITGLQHQSDAVTPNAGSTVQFFSTNYV